MFRRALAWGALLAALGLALAARYGLGTPISEELARQYDLRPVVLPDGRGLPPGEGRVEEGQRIYAQKCASCHGENGEGYPFNRLVSEPFPITPDTEPVEYAIGNYWPYATTLFDYIRRAMPFGQEGTLTQNLHLFAAGISMLGDPLKRAAGFPSHEGCHETSSPIPTLDHPGPHANPPPAGILESPVVPFPHRPRQG
ncbi:c-type cytochrome [Thermus thermophilus]|uniref:c-type cytochrome n=1 Tax=Thermus thermophilus TaxID=274 RepID=UPI001FCB1C87|nr:cytochrome c [Thermus thermophilus]BDG21801.1 hypothetical protein TthSNM17_14630 [Thermus thermophilus]